MLRPVFEGLLWVSTALLFYIYAGYPILIALLSRRPRRLVKFDGHFPSVSLIISAHNESQVIATKLENAISLDYPRDLLEVMVISDCSDDGTDEIVEQFFKFGVRLIRQKRRLGKTAGLNLGVPQTTGQVLIFSDANALYRPDAIRQLVSHFSDPRVGYVVGNARYIENQVDSQSAESEGLYWRLETWLKRCESLFHSVVGGDGAIYAIRRELYSPLQPSDINDFLNPLQIVDRGYVGVFEPAAVSCEEAAGKFSQEFGRKIRIVSRSFRAVTQVPGVLNPLKDPRHWFMLVSHKLLRWLAPFFMLVLLAASLALWKFPFYRTSALLQGAFYSLALIGWLLDNRGPRWKIFHLSYYFCLVNLASLIGVVKCLRGDLSGTWNTVRGQVPGEVKSR